MPAPAGSPANADEERAVTALMSDPATYGNSVSEVEVIETHIARVFLAGDEAYKIKKRVHLPFLDFTTLEERERACSREIEINQPHAPDLYFGLVAITRGPDGTLQLNGTGETVDWAVHMRRFDQGALLARISEWGPFPDDLSKSLASMVARYHRGCAISLGLDGARVISPIVDQLTQALGGTSDWSSRSQSFLDRLPLAFAHVVPRLTERGKSGALRRCHGDLHLGNIVMMDGEPVPFDALEFSERLATIDVLYDLAFLLMDLEFRGDRHAANVVLNAYVSAAPIDNEIEGLACLPLFLACRAGIRAIVEVERMAQLSGRQQDEQRENAERHIALGGKFLAPPPPVLIAVGGLSGTGKSTLAALLAPLIGAAPGALHLRSDVERKRLFGVPETQRLDRAHYRIGTAQRVYSILENKTYRTLRSGHAAIVDAVFAMPEERAVFEALARATGCNFVGLWLTAPGDVLIERVETRSGDASDADRRVVKEQLRYDLGDIRWAKVDTGGSQEECVENAKAALRAANVRLEE